MNHNLLFPIFITLLCTSCSLNADYSQMPTLSSDTTITEPIELPSHSTDEDIITYSGFTTSYNHKNLIPNWVAYERTSEELEPVYTDQCSTFSMDFSVKGRQASREDYSHSGWDKGHMAPKADLRWSEDAFWESYYFTNVCPQDHELNAGDWNTLEKKVRSWAREFGSVYIVCGPIIENGTYGTIGQKKVVIPDKFFKAVVVPTNGTYTAIAFIMPNNGQHHKLSEYACSVDELEDLIGRNLFYALDKMGIESIESNKDLTSLHIK
jgi:endonuclease G